MERDLDSARGDKGTQNDSKVRADKVNSPAAAGLFLFFININRGTLGEGDAIGGIEGFQMDLVIADAQLDRHDSPQQLSVLVRIERRRWQFVPPLLLTPVAHFPHKIFVGFIAEPRFQHISDAEAFTLTSEEAPRALQPKPELHKAFLIVLNLHFNI